MITIKKSDKYGNDKFNPEIEGEDSLNPQNSESYLPVENIKVERNQYSIYELKRKYDRTRKDRQENGYSKRTMKNQLILDSPFQREEVWNRKQQSELIESVLMGLPLPIMYFSEDENANLIVVDGRQRLTAFFKYLDNEYGLSDLKILNNISTKKFDDLDPILQAKLEDFQLIVQIIKPPTEDAIKFQIFDRVNRGGTPLNNQEMRNALYQGNASVLLRQLAESDEFKKLTNNGISPKRMKDRYIILRAIAFYLFRINKIKHNNKHIEYRNMDDLLGKTMEFINYQEDDFLNELENSMLNAFNLASEVLDENAFRLTKTNKRKSPINMNVFEVWIYLMIILEDKKVSNVILKEKYEELIKNPKFLDSIANHRDSGRKVDIRYSMVDRIYEEVVL